MIVWAQRARSQVGDRGRYYLVAHALMSGASRCRGHQVQGASGRMETFFCSPGKGGPWALTWTLRLTHITRACPTAPLSHINHPFAWNLRVRSPLHLGEARIHQRRPGLQLERPRADERGLQRQTQCRLHHPRLSRRGLDAGARQQQGPQPEQQQCRQVEGS